MKRVLYLIAGFLCLGLGCVGIVLPILPTVPFFMCTVFCFAKSSQRLHEWFTGTKMYHKHLESFMQKKGMTIRAKVTIMGSVTLMMAVGFVLMHQVPVGRAVLAVVWVAHVFFFIVKVKTIRAEEA